jgi:hypothetical protein
VTVANNNFLKSFPNKRIKAIDGMAVTADVWEGAHTFHRDTQQYHNLYSHGSGIVTGMQVIASDPPDTAVYILPGVAIDTAGRTIAITEPTAYDVGKQVEGPLYLVMMYGESRPRPESSQSTQEGAPLFVQSEFSIQALNALPAAPHIELARIRRQGRTAALIDANDALHPGANEIDLRWRRQSGGIGPATVGVAVYYAGMAERQHGRGLMNLARAADHHRHFNVVVDDNAPLTESLGQYALVCAVGQRAFQLTDVERKALTDYAQAGGTVYLESCRREGAPGSDQSFAELAAAFGAKLEDVRPGSALLSTPNFFAALPTGFEGQGGLKAGGGVILSLADYACVWQGERRGSPASREEIRSALELGENILHYAVGRRQAADK